MPYKYLVPERIDVLRDQRIRFTQPSALNDPFELQAYFDRVFSKEDLDKRIDLDSAVAAKTVSSGLAGAYDVLLKRTENWMRSRIAEMMDEIGILSLSEDPTNELMWAHYAASHRGFLIGFDESDPFFNRRRNAKDQFFHLRRVIYRTPAEAPTLGSFEIGEVFLSKSPSWSYEREQRMLVPLRSADTCLNDPAGKIYLFSFGPRCVCRVVVDSEPYKHVELCYARLNRRTEGIEISH